MARLITDSLPVVPTRVLFSLKPQPWIIYDVADLSAAVVLAAAFSPWAEYVHAQDVFTHLKPASMLEGEQITFRTYIPVVGGSPHLKLQTIDNVPPLAELAFFTNTVQGKIARVVISMKQAPAAIRISRSAGHRKEYPRVYEDREIRWSTGGVAMSASSTYVWYSVESYADAMEKLLPYTRREEVLRVA